MVRESHAKTQKARGEGKESRKRRGREGTWRRENGGRSRQKERTQNGGHDDAKMLIRAMQSGENSGVGK